ncbi:unnamed protein product, partial [Protopolystoma xenopodis]
GASLDSSAIEALVQTALDFQPFAWSHACSLVEEGAGSGPRNQPNWIESGNANPCVQSSPLLNPSYDTGGGMPFELGLPIPHWAFLCLVSRHVTGKLIRPHSINNANSFGQRENAELQPLVTSSDALSRLSRALLDASKRPATCLLEHENQNELEKRLVIRETWVCIPLTVTRASYILLHGICHIIFYFVNGFPGAKIKGHFSSVLINILAYIFTLLYRPVPYMIGLFSCSAVENFSEQGNHFKINSRKLFCRPRRGNFIQVLYIY